MKASKILQLYVNNAKIAHEYQARFYEEKGDKRIAAWHWKQWQLFQDIEDAYSDNLDNWIANLQTQIANHKKAIELMSKPSYKAIRDCLENEIKLLEQIIKHIQEVQANGGYPL